MSDKWDRRFLDLAEHIASWSKDPSSKCGAVIVRPDRTIASVGYNGFPRNMVDDPAFYADRPKKMSRVIHAEMNAIFNARDESLSGYTLYVWPALCCDRCAVAVIQVGIRDVVAPRPPSKDLEQRWSLETSRGYFAEAGVVVTEMSHEPS